MPSEAHCQADRGINAEFSRKILDRSVTILLDKNKNGEKIMRNKFVQISLLDIYNDISSAFEDQKSIAFFIML